MYMSLCIAALVTCSGRESLIVRVSRARSLYKGEAHATCALNVLRYKFTALVNISLCSCRLDCVRRWANTNAEQVEENESAVDEQTATQAASGRREKSRRHWWCGCASSRQPFAVRTPPTGWRRVWASATACARWLSLGLLLLALLMCVTLHTILSVFHTRTCQLSLSTLRVILYSKL